MSKIPTGVRTHDSKATALISAMPKTELHLHLDGSLRVSTLLDLAQKHEVALPAEPEQLSQHCVVPEDCQDLVQMLSYFALPVSVLQTRESLERVTYELCQDVRRENVRYVEIRFGPTLHRNGGMGLDEIIGAVVKGWEVGRKAFGLSGGIILCALRNLRPDENLEVAKAGVRFLGQGVVGFDLAGDEANFPLLLHREPLLWAKSAGYGMTAHAGEASGAQSVRDAVEVIGVSRVGHGVRADEDPTLMSLLREWRISLDMCPTSNVQTRSVPDLSHHPLARYYRQDIRVTASTDNRTVSDTTMSRELELSHRYMGLSIPDLARITITSLEVGFAPESDRRGLILDYKRELTDLGILPA